MKRAPAHTLRLLFALFAAVWAAGSCMPGAESADRDVWEFSGATMGTVYHVKLVVDPRTPPERDRIQAAISGELDDVNARMSTYQPDSELQRFNAFRSTAPFEASELLTEVFAIARKVSRDTGGALDVTVGPLVDAWGFGPKAAPERPLPDAEVNALLETVGFEKVIVDPAKNVLRKTNANIACDLSAVAKGYAVDRVARALEELGCPEYMVEVGGEVRTNGCNADGVPWRIGIVKPDAMGNELEQIVPMDGWAMATSGDYRNYFERDGVRYSHMLDPRTGRPITHNLASVSVIHKECAFADAWATALTVLGPEDGMRCAEEHGIVAFFIVRNGAQGGFQDLTTKAFDAFVEEAKAPNENPTVPLE